MTLLVTAAPLIDAFTADTISQHVRDAYPSWPADSVSADRTAILGYLVAIGVGSIAGWTWVIRLLTRSPGRALKVATTLFVLGALVALTDVSYGAAPYDTIIPLSYGLLGLLPVLIGAAAVVQLWREPRRQPAGALPPSRVPLGPGR